MNFYWLILGILSVWRITHLFNAEDGPWDVIVRFRHSIGDGVFGKLLDCFLCLSLWISIPFALWIGIGWRERSMLWLSMSAGAIIIERIIGRNNEKTPSIYYEEKE